MDVGSEAYGRWFRRIRTSHEMSRAEVVECCRLGGLEITGSTAEAWARNPRDARRSVRMTEAQFEAFTAGLVTWRRGVEEK